MVNVGGYHCNEIGAKKAVRHPVASMEQYYFLTEGIPATGFRFRAARPAITAGV